MKYLPAWRRAMHFHIDTADFVPLFLTDFCAVNRSTTAKAVRSQTRFQCYSSLASCVCPCIGFLTVLGRILSDKPTLLAVLHFPDRVTESFKRFDAQLIAAFFLTTLLRSILTLREIDAAVSVSAKPSIFHRDVDRRTNFR
jgi:hypothetical protein